MTPDQPSSNAMSVTAAASMGVGAMVGAGIFALMGTATAIAGNLVYVSFGIAGLITLLLGYSYSKLGARYPSMGGPIEYLVQGFGGGTTAGTFNILYWVAMTAGIAMVAKAFGGYAAALAPARSPWANATVFTSAVITGFTLLNFIGSRAIGRVEKWIVGVKVAILLIFAGVALLYLKPGLLTPDPGKSAGSVLNATGIVFFAYTGFGIIANTAEDLPNPKKDLPRAIFLCIIVVTAIYLLIAVAVTGNLTYDQIVASKDYALAEAAKPSLGEAGFRVMAVAALLSTASAINASLYGAANVSFMIAKKGELPEFFERRLWKHSTGGLLITSGAIFTLANFLDLSSIAGVGSAVMLAIYILVNIGHLRLIDQTGAKPWIIWVAMLACVLILASFLRYQWQTDRVVLIVFAAAVAGAFGVETIMQKAVGRKLLPHALHAP